MCCLVNLNTSIFKAKGFNIGSISVTTNLHSWVKDIEGVW